MSDVHTDILASDLLKEVKSSRIGYDRAYDQMWRLERLLRYVYWLDHGDHPTFNLVGSWTEEDLRTELAMWQGFKASSMDEVDAADAILALLTTRFNMSIDEAQRRGSATSLAERHLPIWDMSTGSLVPQTLGPWLLKGAHNHEQEKADLGVSYFFAHPDHKAPLTITLYGSGHSDIRPGIEDEHVMTELRSAMRDLEVLAESNGTRVEWLSGPFEDPMMSSQDIEVPSLVVAGLVGSTTQTISAENVGILGFRGGVLKVRLSIFSGVYWESEQLANDAKLFNTGAADFIVMYGP